ncbi:MAG: hypothetical protein J7501_12485 [Bdellovibrio sp.]|nr:hypothetical protein [Bdellovibrio sp.]
MKRLMSGVLVMASFAWAPTVEAGYSIRVIASEDSNYITDSVRQVRSSGEGVQVVFAHNQKSYQLKKDSKKFADFKKKLESSQSSKRDVTVTLDAAGLNILDVK